MNSIDAEIKTNTLEYRINNPLCCFCKHSYIEFFHTWCSLNKGCKNICAKGCKDYDPKTC